MQIPLKFKHHGNTQSEEYLFVKRKNFDPFVEMMKQQSQSDLNLFKKAFNIVASSRIHAQHLNDKREIVTLTVHKKKRVNLKSEFKLPSIGEGCQTDRIRIKFPPKKIKKIFA